eukprot:TRINITY_DN31799_c0_g1_i2.p1 TRINITY_DN31799_c0_g1~~TRINITY_DN31799_c0_g1_i2.p1  ORF type:complete len:661 (+),score=192.49 TRINITY_DN31799_c0_g1_i2:246-2228(+)
MGCGGSTAANASVPATEEQAKSPKAKEKKAANEKQDDSSKKYEAGASGSPTAKSGPATPRSPGHSPRGDPGKTTSPIASPKKRKKGKMSPRGEPDRLFRKIETTKDLPCSPGESTTTFAIPQHRQYLKSDKDEISRKFRCITTGEMTLARGPPPITPLDGTPPPKVLTVHSDIAPSFTLNLTQEEIGKITSLSDTHQLDLKGITISDMLESRLQKTRYRGANLRGVHGFVKPLTAVAISSDDRLLTTALGRAKNIPVRDAGIGLGLSEHGSRSGSIVSHHSRASSSASSLAGQVKVEALSRVIRCIDSRTATISGSMKQKCFDPEATSDMLFTNEDQHLLSCSSEGSVFIWNIGRMKVHKTLEIGQDYNPPGRLHQVRVSPDGKTVAACGEDIDDDGRTVGQVPVWDVDSAKQILSFQSHKAPVLCLAFHPDSKHIASGDRHGSILLWVVTTGEVLKKIKGHTISMRSVYFLPNNLFMSADERFTRVWDAAADYRPMWTKHIDTTEGKKFEGKFKPTGLAGADDESDESEEEDEAQKDVPPSPRKDGEQENMSSSGSRSTMSVPQSPKCPKSLVMQAPANQSKLRQRMVVPVPCGLLMSCLSIREIQLIDVETGDVCDTFQTKAPVACAAGGRAAAVLGDIWGNVYSLDFEVSNPLPATM